MTFQIYSLRGKIIACHTNLVSRVCFPSGTHATGRSESSGDVTDLKFESHTRTQTCI